MAQPCPQIVEHLIRDMNPKRFHYNKSLLTIVSDEPNAQAMSRGSRRSLSTDRHGAPRPGSIPLRHRLNHAPLFTHDNVLYHSLYGLANARVQFASYRGQPTLELGWGVFP
jgi:hypothetical protein